MIKSLEEIPGVKAYLKRIGAEVRSLKTAVVRENRGKYWVDVAVIRFSKDGDVTAPDAYKPTAEEVAAFKVEFTKVQWPELKLLKEMIKPPQEISAARPENIYICRNAEGLIVMVQVRTEIKGEKAYLPWTFWSDDVWRMAEPEGKLPLFNGELLKGAATVFVHEGAKAARFCQKLVEGTTRGDRERLRNHPWGEELTHAVHVGWLGGALSPYRTDWSAIAAADIKRVYIVADNDQPGKIAVPRIAEQLRVPTYYIQFTDEFPASFDLADEFPEKMFATHDAIKYYTGPSFRDCLHPATWATDLIEQPKGKPIVALRDCFRTQWAFIEEVDMFVHTEMPDIMRNENVLNKQLAPFSHVQNIAQLIAKNRVGRSTKLCYRPDQAGSMVTAAGTSAINLHVPGRIKPMTGDEGPWIKFLKHLFPHESEMKQIARWCATLIARPDIRMSYALLLISEHQGMGKTTLGANILAPLIGEWNVGFPSDADINSPFNFWVANKRLAVISEVYSGSSWKSYHALKSIITDRDIAVNQKYQRQYTVENYCHIFACSNSMRALKIENDDRRWFCPEVTERPWGGAKFKEFRQWLKSGGLSIIMCWANNFHDYVMPDERAPMTERKREMIEGSRSEAQREAAAIAQAINFTDRPIALIMKDVVAWCRQTAQGKVFDSDYELRKAMIEAGVYPMNRRMKVGSRLEYILMNKKLFELVNEQHVEDEDVNENDFVRKHIVRCAELMEMAM